MTSRHSREESRMELGEESAGTAEIGMSHSTSSSGVALELDAASSRPAFHPDRVVEAMAGSILEGGKNPAAKDEEEKPHDFDELMKWLKDENVSEEAIEHLDKEGFNSFYAFAHIQREDVDFMELSKNQRALVLYLAEEAKQKATVRSVTPSSGRSGVTKKEKSKITMGNVTMVCQNVSGKVAIVSQHVIEAPEVCTRNYHSSVQTGILGNVGGEAAGKPSKSKKTKFEKFSKSSDFSNWLKSSCISKRTMNALVDDGFDSFGKLTKIKGEDIQTLGINRAQIRLVETVVKDLQTREKKKEFPFSKGHSDDDDHIEMKNVKMVMENVTGEVSVVRKEKIISNQPVQIQNFLGRVTAGVIGNVAPGASVGSIHVGEGPAAVEEEAFPVRGFPPESPLSDSALSELAALLAEEWYALGCQLGVPAVKLKQLHLDNPHSVHNQSFEALCLWRNKVCASGSDVENLRVLIRCLKHPAVQRNDLADDLARKYGISGDE